MAKKKYSPRLKFQVVLGSSPKSAVKTARGAPHFLDTFQVPDL